MCGGGGDELLAGVARDDSIFHVFEMTRYRGLSNIRSAYMSEGTTICCGLGSVVGRYVVSFGVTWLSFKCYKCSIEHQSPESGVALDRGSRSSGARSPSLHRVHEVFHEGPKGQKGGTIASKELQVCQDRSFCVGFNC